MKAAVFHGPGDIRIEDVPDPRIKLPLSAYQEQFALARQVEALRKPLSDALDEAEKAAPKLANNPALLQRVVEVSGIINSPNAANLWWLPPKTTSTAEKRSPRK